MPVLDKTRKTVRGRILLVQEERFRLLGEKGQAYLFTLSHKTAPRSTICPWRPICHPRE